jgi:hypothetical protein
VKKALLGAMPVILSLLVVACGPASLEPSTTQATTPTTPESQATLTGHLLKSDIDRDTSPEISQS